MLRIISFFIILGFIFSQPCPQSPIKEFDASLYLGRWFEIKVFPTPFQPNLACVSATYGYTAANNISVFNQGIDEYILIRRKGKLETINGSATVPDANKPNHLLVILRVPIGSTGVTLPTTGKLDVWETDYSNYSLVYSCSGNQTGETAWILSRTRTLDNQTIDYLEGVLKSKNVDPGKFKITSQTNCPN